MLAQIPHVLLKLMREQLEVESNGMQFYPDASSAQQRFIREFIKREGQLDLSTISGLGFGYRIAEID